jgi:glycosyl hydrolase family 12
MMSRFGALALTLAALAGCGSSSSGDQTGPDGSPGTDAGGGVDGASSPSDAGASDQASPGSDSGGVEGGDDGGDGSLPASACQNPVFTTSSPTGGQTFGSYYVYNNMWNTSATLGPQTLYVCSYDDWYVVSNQTDQQGAVLTYPNVQENFSQAVSSFKAISSTFAETSPHVGIYEDAYDIWFDGFGAGHTELMIWVDNFNQVPAGSKAATVTLGGRTYDAYRTTDGSYIAFVATVTFTSGTVDLLEIFNWIVGQNWLTSSATLSQIDFGVEIVDTAGSPATYDFTNFFITTQ